MNSINVSRSVVSTNEASEIGRPQKAPMWEKPADLVIIYGPDTDQHTLMSMLDSAEKKCLTVKLIGDAEKSLNLDDIAACRHSGAMGPLTQVLITMHGMRNEAGHFINVGTHGECVSSAAFMHLLRGTHPDGAAVETEPDDAAWTGTVHLMSCESGKMRNEIYKDKALWRSGHYVLHASGKVVMKDSALSNAVSIIDYLGECKREHSDPDLHAMSRRLIEITGESFTLAGAKLIAPLIVHAPKTPEHTSANYLSADEKTDKKKTISGNEKDIRQLLSAEKEDRPSTIGHPTGHPLEKALNTFNVRLARKKFNEAANLLNHFPELALGIKGKTPPIIETSFRGHVPILSKLIALGADIHVRDNSGFTPIALACLQGHRGAVDLLVNAGAVTDDYFDQTEMSILQLAAMSNSADLVSDLAGLPQIAEFIDYQNINEMTALHLAAQKGNTNMIRALKDHDADLTVQDLSGSTALHYAVLAGEPEAIRLLANGTALAGIEDDEGITPLHLAAQRGDREAMTILINAQAQVSAQDDSGQSALHFAIKSGKLDAVSFLVGLPGLLDLQDKDGNTPLHLAAGAGKLDMVRILRGARPKLVLKNKDGHIPVVLAGLNGHLDVVKDMLTPSTRKKKAKPEKLQS